MNRRSLLGLMMATVVASAEDVLSGKWDVTLDTEGGERKATPTFVLEGTKVSGKWDASDVKGKFDAGKLELEFPLMSSEAGYSAPLKVAAKLEGATLAGTWSWASYGGKLSGKKL